MCSRRPTPSRLIRRVLPTLSANCRTTASRRQVETRLAMRSRSSSVLRYAGPRASSSPFGTKIPIKGKEVLEQFDLGHKFERSKEDKSTYVRSDTRLESQPPQLLFIERSLQLLKPGGRMGIVLPESIFGMPTYTHVVQY